MLTHTPIDTFHYVRSHNLLYNTYTRTQLQAQYDPKAEEEAKEWLEAVSGEDFEGEFFAVLKDGSYLCRYIERMSTSIYLQKYGLQYDYGV